MSGNAHRPRPQAQDIADASGAAARSTLTGALDAETLEALLHVVDERLRGRAMVSDRDDPAPGGAPGSGGAGDPLPLPAAGALAQLAAPLFDDRVGSSLVRAAKRLLNVPLRLVGGPQAYFNDTVRQLLQAWDELLRAVLESEAMVQRELTRQRDAIDRLTALVETLRTERAAPAPLRVAIGATAAHWLTVGERPGPGVALVAKAGRLPFRDGRVDELRVVGVVERVAPDLLVRELLPAWHGVLRPGGLLRLVARNGHPLVQLLAQAGFVDCRVVQLPAALPAMEVVAIRPSA